jgi:hypothetical protein
MYCIAALEKKLTAEAMGKYGEEKTKVRRYI